MIDAVKIVFLILGSVMGLYSIFAFARFAKDKYQLRLISSFTFASLLCCALFLFFAGHLAYSQGGIEHVEIKNFTSGLIYLSAAACCGIFSFYRNIAQSNLGFGLIFSFVQLAVALCLVALVIWFLYKKFPKRFPYLQRI